MARRIRQTSDLPPWFNLEKYARAGKLTTRGWYEHLLLRRNLLNEARLASRKRPKIDQPGGATNIGVSSKTQQALMALRNTPLAEISSHALLKPYLYDGSPRVGKRHPNIMAGVRLAKVLDVYKAERLCLDDEERSEARRYFDRFFNRKKRTDALKYHSWFDRPVDDVADHFDGEILVRVNMLLPDSLLVDQFKQMLESLRSPSSPAATSFRSAARKPDISRWVEYGVLPYLDLNIWEYESGAHIPKRVVADAIFPFGEKGEEDMRKTISKAAYDALRWNNLVSLSSLVAHE